MTTLTFTGRAVQDVLATVFWAGGQAIHHGTNAAHATRRIWRNEVASGALRDELLTTANNIQDGIDDALESADAFLNEWQMLSDSFRGLLCAVFVPVTLLLWGAACDVAMMAARTLGRAWGYWAAQGRYEVPLALFAGVACAASFIRALRADARRAATACVGGCDRFLQRAFCLV